MLRFYAYKGCDSCRKARKWLTENGIEFTEIAIRETPPARDELQNALTALGNLRLLFNTSGADYRQLGMKDKLSGMDDEDALKILSQNGNLVKRPFLTGTDISLVGFKPDDWERALLG